MKRIGALSAPLGPNCPRQSHPGPPHKLLMPLSLSAPASKLRPQSSLLAWAVSQCAYPQSCLPHGLQTYAVVYLQSGMALDTHYSLVSHLLLLLPGFPGWILCLTNHLDLTGSADGPCHQHLLCPICPDAANCVSILTLNLAACWS